MVSRRYLFIEGTNDTSNGDLRRGFRILLEQKLSGSMPTISMGESKLHTIRKFLHSPGSRLLCDLDANSQQRENDLQTHALANYRDRIFYMIQEMESWFISQPSILDKFYSEKISDKLAAKRPIEFVEPDKELQKLTRNTKKGTYHKVRHGTMLLTMLDANQLYQDFSDFKHLVDSINNE